jgi:hypothetical protein
MNPIAYVRDNLIGAWHLMFGRPEGLNRLDITLEGFWRSFGAFALILPLFLLANIGFGAMLPEEVGNDWLDWVGVLIQGVDWVAFPIVFALIAPRIGLASRYVPFITARNWGAVIVAALYAAGGLPGLLVPVPLIAAAALNVICVAINLRLSYLLARTALVVGPSTAIPVVAMDFLLSFVILLGIGTALEGSQ